jgi:uncharacterized protein (DUF697 family)
MPSTRTRTAATPRPATPTSRKRGLSIPNPVSTAREMFGIVREMSFDDLREAALRLPRIAVVGLSVADARLTAESFFGPEARQHIVALGEDDAWPHEADVVLVDRRVRGAGRPGDRGVLGYDPGESREQVLKALFAFGDDSELRVGRTFPVTRPAAATYAINATSLANGQFALVSNIPTMVPVVGDIMAIGADTIVLTKNQLMLIYKLAAIHGRDLEQRWRIYSEMLPIVGAAMFWRSVARDLVTLIPFWAGTIPKVAIAFAGTYAAGMAAHLYYLEGKRVSPERMRAFYRDALQLARRQHFTLPARAGQLQGQARALPARARDLSDSARTLPGRVRELRAGRSLDSAPVETIYPAESSGPMP